MARNNDVHVNVFVDYRGTTIAKAVTISGDETDSVKVAQALDLLSRQINGMVQIAQSQVVKSQES